MNSFLRNFIYLELSLTKSMDLYRVNADKNEICKTKFSVEPLYEIYEYSWNDFQLNMRVYMTLHCIFIAHVARACKIDASDSKRKDILQPMYIQELWSKGRRSQWPCGLRHEPSSPAPTLGSWLRIPPETWMSVCVYSVFVLFCLKAAALRRADPPFEELYRLCID
jgi:hypothetical protein